MDSHTQGDFHEQCSRAPGWIFDRRDETKPNYMGINMGIIKLPIYGSPYKPIGTMATAVEACRKIHLFLQELSFTRIQVVPPKKDIFPMKMKHPILLSANEINNMYIGYPSPSHFHTNKSANEANSIPLQSTFLAKPFLETKTTKSS